MGIDGLNRIDKVVWIKLTKCANFTHNREGREEGSGGVDCFASLDQCVRKATIYRLGWQLYLLERWRELIKQGRKRDRSICVILLRETGAQFIDRVDDTSFNNVSKG